MKATIKLEQREQKTFLGHIRQPAVLYLIFFLTFRFRIDRGRSMPLSLVNVRHVWNPQGKDTDSRA